MKMRNAFLLSFLFLIFYQYAFPSPEIRFRRITVDEGLSQNIVYSIIQDRHHNVWFGTHDGLNTFDGYKFTVFRNIKGDSLSIASNTIHSLFVDIKGDLWAGNINHISRYDEQAGSFENFTVPGIGFAVNGITDSPDGRKLLLAADKGLMVFDTEQKRLAIKAFIPDVVMNCICRNGQTVLLGTSEGIYAYSVEYENLTPVMAEIGHSQVTRIVYREGSGYWIATNGNGLFQAGESLDVDAHFTYSVSADQGFTSDYLRAVEFDRSGRLWIGSSYQGLFIYDTSTGQFDSYQHDQYDPYSICHRSIRCIYADNQDGVWLGSYYGGVNYYHPLAFRFGSMHHSPAGNSLSDNTVSCIVEDASTGNLWIGTNRDGVNYYDISSRSFTTYSLVSGDGPRQTNDVKCIVPDEYGNLYIGSHMGGVSYLDVRSRSVTTYAVNSEVPISNSVYAMMDGLDGTLWVGTLDGMFLFDKTTRRFCVHPLTGKRSELSRLSYNTFYRDSRQRVWIGTKSGIYLYLPETADLHRFGNMDPSNFGNTMSFLEDTRGRIWVGTDRGLYMYREASDDFENYTIVDGLPNDVIYGILEDDLQRLWLSTNRGLSCFTPYDGNFRNYSNDEGIGSNQFSQSSYCKGSDGRMYFGSLKGITYFDPHNLMENTYTPEVKITGLTLMNRNIDMDDGVDYDYGPDGEISGIRIPARLNLVGIEFVVTNFLAGTRNRYAYKLEGFNTDWYYTNSCEVNFSNLRPGRYIFRVKAANNDGRWCNETTDLNIVIVPKWYNTTAAKVSYILILAGLGYLVFRFFVSRAKMKVQLFHERMEKRSIEKAGEDKIKFYVNSSHELRTPLTLILAPLQEIRSHGVSDNFVKSRIEYIYNNSLRLYRMVNQLLDDRKAELGMMKLKVRPTGVENIVGEIFVLFERNALSRDIDYRLDSTLGNAEYPIDKLFLERILVNLLSNAFRFTPDKGTIKVSLECVDTNVVLRVRDSGKGIKPDKVDKIFDRFYQINESHSGTGIGLSIVKRLTELHHGTVEVRSVHGEFTEFEVKLPADIAAYTPEEIEQAENPADTAEYGLVANADDFSIEYYQDDRSAPELTEGRETLMIVEDNVQIRHYLADHFRQKYNVVTASDGEEALELIRSNEPDIVVSDIMMPGIDGIGLCRMIKQNLRTCHIPVVLLTAKDGTVDRKKGAEAGADAYIAKPFEIDFLDTKISNLLKLKYRLRNYYLHSSELDPEKVTSNKIDGEFLKKAVAVVEKNMDNISFSADDFCREMHMSRSGLHMKIKSLTGDSTTRFIHRIRINEAC